MFCLEGMSPPQKPTDRKQKRRRKARKDVAAMSTAPPEDGALVERKRQQQQQQQHDSRVDSSSISNSNKTRDQGSGQNKAVLSGKLYRCAPLFAPS